MRPLLSLPASACKTTSIEHQNIRHTEYSGYNDIARDRKNYVGFRKNRHIRSKYKRKTTIGTEENMSDVAEIVIPGVVITGVHCIKAIYKNKETFS